MYPIFTTNLYYLFNIYWYFYSETQNNNFGNIENFTFIIIIIFFVFSSLKANQFGTKQFNRKIKTKWNFYYYYYLVKQVLVRVKKNSSMLRDVLFGMVKLVLVCFFVFCFNFCCADNNCDLF